MVPTAGFLVIGDEILSGKTKDRNIGTLADGLSLVGIDLHEVRIVADSEAAIIAGLNALRASCSYVFTSGGIGPTHDDITADSVAKALGVAIDVDPRAYKLLTDWYAKTGRQMNSARERMTRIPHGADLIDNPVSVAPGFKIENVFVLAGVPDVFRAMLDQILPRLDGGVPISVETIPFPVGEGDIGDVLADLDARHPGVSVGSYPKLIDGRFTTEIVLRSRNMAALDAAREALEKLRVDVASSAERGVRPCE